VIVFSPKDARGVTGVLANGGRATDDVQIR
jgi:hypothetical protein